MNDETPYAVVTRMTAEGHPRKAIIARLKAMGLDDSDISVLTFKDLPPPDEGESNSNLLLAVGAAVVAGPIVGSLVAVALSDSGGVPAEPLAPQQALNPMDTAARCACAPRLASVASCPRCGSFTCRECAPKPDESICQTCRVSPVNRDRRIRNATRWVSLWMFVVAGMALMQAHEGMATRRLEFTLIDLALVAGPFTLLGIIQATQRRLWPALVAVVVVFPALLFLRMWGLWIVFAVVLSIASLFARSEIIAARKDCVEPSK